MKKNVFILLAAISSFFFIACDSTEEEGAGVSVVGEGVYYVLNAGDWKSNNSSLTMYDASNGNVVQGFFELQNGRCLGNNANDMLVYGSKMYIAVAGESTIEVAGLDAKSVAQVNCGAQPRYLAAHKNKVYISLYDGYVARLDTATLKIEAKVAVGRNPEQLAVVGDKLYVANSGGMDYNTALGYDNSVSVIDLVEFKEVKKVEVVINPAVVVPCGDALYVASFGDYMNIPSTLQRIDLGSDAVSVVEQCSNMTEFCCKSGVLYGFFSQYDENWVPTITYLSFDTFTGVVDSPWIKEKVLPVPYKISLAGDYLCVTSSDYINDGDVYFYDTDGVSVAVVPAGLNPVKTVRVK